MNRLGIDYGEKRWGLSFSDDLGIATPMPAITSLDLDQKWEHLARVVKERRVREFVVGYPLNMDGTVGFKASEVDRFVTQLRDRFEGRSVFLVDERLTSELAGEGWSEKKKRQERQSGKLDSRAATLILQDYLDQQDPQVLDVDEEGFYEE